MDPRIDLPPPSTGSGDGTSSSSKGAAALAARLERDVANLRGDLTIAQRKLGSKTEALIILTADLDACRTERDQYKLAAEQLQARHVAIKKQLAGVVVEGRTGGDLEVDQLWRLLTEHQAKSKAVALEAENLRQRLAESEGDNRALREQLGRHRIGESELDSFHRRNHRNNSEQRETLVASLEAERQKNDNLKRDMRQVLDQKEELVVERDSLLSKHERLNKEMNLLLRGDPERILDLDALTMENAYLKRELERSKEERNKDAVTISKYRALLQNKVNKVIGNRKMKPSDERPATGRGGGSGVGGDAATSGGGGLPANVEALAAKLLAIPPDRASPQAVVHLQKLIVFLRETLLDRNLAIVHQRKTNQILGKKIQALENRLRNDRSTIAVDITQQQHQLSSLRAHCSASPDASTYDAPFTSGISVSGNASTDGASTNVGDDDKGSDDEDDDDDEGGYEENGEENDVSDLLKTQLTEDQQRFLNSSEKETLAGQIAAPISAMSSMASASVPSSTTVNPLSKDLKVENKSPMDDLRSFNVEPHSQTVAAETAVTSGCLVRNHGMESTSTNEIAPERLSISAHECLSVSQSGGTDRQLQKQSRQQSDASACVFGEFASFHPGNPKNLEDLLSWDLDEGKIDGIDVDSPAILTPTVLK